MMDSGFENSETTYKKKIAGVIYKNQENQTLSFVYEENTWDYYCPVRALSFIFKDTSRIFHNIYIKCPFKDR